MLASHNDIYTPENQKNATEKQLNFACMGHGSAPAGSHAWDRIDPGSP